MASKAKTLQRFLRDQRAKSGYSQKEVAAAAGYSSAQFISNVERGLCQPPVAMLKIMIKLYRLPERELMDILLADQRARLRKQLFS